MLKVEDRSSKDFPLENKNFSCLQRTRRQPWWSPPLQPHPVFSTVCTFRETENTYLGLILICNWWNKTKFYNQVLYWSISTFCSFIFPLHYICFIHLVTSFFADSDYWLFHVTSQRVLWAGHQSQSNTFLNQLILPAIWQIIITNNLKKSWISMNYHIINSSCSTDTYTTLFLLTNHNRSTASTGSFHPAANKKTGTREKEIWHHWLESNRQCCKGHAAMWSALLAFGSKLSGQISTQNVKRFKMG